MLKHPTLGRWGCHPPTTGVGYPPIAMENPPFEDVFSIRKGEFPVSCLFYWRVHHLEREGRLSCAQLVQVPDFSKIPQQYHLNASES